MVEMVEPRTWRATPAEMAEPVAQVALSQQVRRAMAVPVGQAEPVSQESQAHSFPLQPAVQEVAAAASVAVEARPRPRARAEMVAPVDLQALAATVAQVSTAWAPTPETVERPVLVAPAVLVEILAAELRVMVALADIR